MSRGRTNQRGNEVKEEDDVPKTGFVYFFGDFCDVKGRKIGKDGKAPFTRTL